MIEDRNGTEIKVGDYVKRLFDGRINGLTDDKVYQVQKIIGTLTPLWVYADNGNLEEFDSYKFEVVKREITNWQEELNDT